MVCTSEVKLKLESKRKFHKSVAQEVLQLKRRLTHLEEETNMMKQEMFQTIAERKTLLSDVYRQLKLVQFSIHPENQKFECNKFCKVICISFFTFLIYNFTINSIFKQLLQETGGREVRWIVSSFI
ncbi:hypothetical protein R6Q59_033905 [Mikania micrantha]